MWNLSTLTPDLWNLLLHFDKSYAQVKFRNQNMTELFITSVGKETILGMG